MKKFLLHTLLGTLLFVSGAVAQNFPKTYTSTSCVNCTPPGYTIVAGGPVALSNMNGLGGSPIKPWIDGFSAPPSSFIAVDNNTNKVFLTLQQSPIKTDVIKAGVGGFEIGVEYTLHYNVMTARADITGGNSDYAISATVQIKNQNQSVASKITTFTDGVNVNKWVGETLTFIAPATYLEFHLSGLANPKQTSFVNFDIIATPFSCVVPGGQVELYHGGTTTTPFACQTINLYDLIKSTTPAGAVPVWCVNPSSGSAIKLTEEEAKAASPQPAGEYYYAFYKTPGGCYNTQTSTAKASFITTPTQVVLTSNQRAINCINQTGVDLTAIVAPSNYKVHWFTNDKHQGTPFANPQAAPVNTYYAFYFDSANKCYSVDKADVGSIFKVLGSTMCCNDPNDPSNQIPLLNTDVKIVAPAQTYDLTKLIPANISIPPNTVIEWYTTVDHSGSPISNPQQVGPGKYYVFAHDLNNGCFNVPLSKSAVNVSKACYAGNTPVTVKSNNIFYCQEGEPQINLNDFVIGTPPPGTTVVWFNNLTHSGAPVTTAVVNGGNYHAFYYDALNDCFSPASSPIYFLSKQVPLLCGEDGCDASTGCPKSGVNLNTFHEGTVPDGWELRWFSNNVHSGEPIGNSTNVIAAGEYFAFYYHLTKHCYNKKEIFYLPGSTGEIVSVTNEACGSGPQLDARVVLQGARSTGSGDDIMRNDLQIYFGNAGLLPTTSPYSDLATCPDINDPVKMSNVADWVKVEVRDATDPSILLESKSLILLASGFVTSLDGMTQPSFTSQPNPVRIVIKHRNHLAVMSNPIQDFSSGVVSYDFTTALSQASNDFGDPVQMVQKNGTWCMQSADLNATQDFVIDGKDGTFFNNQFRADVFDSYDHSDINMDGVVDGVDGTLFNINFYLDIFSTLINY